MTSRNRFLLLLSSCLACTPTDAVRSDPEEAEGSETGGDETTGTAPAETEGSTGEPVVPLEPAAVLSQQLSEDASVSYLLTTPSPSNVLTLDEGIEIPGRAVGVAWGSAVFVGTNASSVLTRYAIDEDLGASETGSFSFINEGVVGFGEYAAQFHVFDGTKAYYFDGGTGRAIVWSPDDMVVRGSFALEGAPLEDALLTFTSTRIATVEGKLYVPAGWRSLDNVTILPQAGIVVVDPDTDTATTIVDGRCGYVRDAAVGDDGFIYVATEAYGAAVHRINAYNAPAPCLLRFDPAAAQFDPTFHVELSSLVDGSTAGSLVQTAGGVTYLRALDESLFPVDEETHPRTLASAPAWSWWRVQLGDTPVATHEPGLDPSSGSMLTYDLSGRTFVANFSADRATTTLHEITTQDGLALTVPGLTFSAMNLR